MQISSQPKKMADNKKPRKKSVSKASKAGLLFAPSRIEKNLRASRVAKSFGSSSSIFLTAAMEHVVSAILQAADSEASSKKGKRLSLQHIIAAVRSDVDLSRLFSGFAFTSLSETGRAMDFILTKTEQKDRKQQKAERVAAKAAPADAIVD